ncbi:hypothetical protein P280DRAFT_554076 [Massarina eburnea CBS 473.64]|uniref:Cora-domain-containing protein n=1 Tax=Massarina eburnea CBS 473.64 TaxID=1395130 RepID=A0A6A6RHR0_9PLEO|nr:hypothetical protein P280DRAFT_554076 [Massarina eburnea CBS 473.64]
MGEPESREQEADVLTTRLDDPRQHDEKLDGGSKAGNEGVKHNPAKKDMEKPEDNFISGEPTGPKEGKGKEQAMKRGPKDRSRHYHPPELDRLSSEASIAEDKGDPSLPASRPNASSLDDLLARTWHNVSHEEASRTSLPQSRVSSSASSIPLDTGPLPPGQSLEQLELRPENITLPRHIKRNQPPDLGAFVRWMTLGQQLGGKSKKRKKKKPHQWNDSRDSISPDALAYRAKIDKLSSHFPLITVATHLTRHVWSARIVFYDCLESEPFRPPRRYEPWRYRASIPNYQEFSSTLRKFSDDCTQRLILVEDLTPSLIDVLGATFQIPPHVFEEHLDGSGYISKGRNTKHPWQIHSSTQGSASINWFRPVLPLIPITSRFRSKLIADHSPVVPCPFKNCSPHNLRLSTLGNIWRRHLDLSPQPGTYHKDSKEEYPIAWEERATVWARNLNDCKFVIILLDPLPAVVHRDIRDATIRRPQLQRPTNSTTKVQNRGGSIQNSKKSKVEEWSSPPPQPPPSVPPPGVMSPQDQTRTTGSTSEHESTPANLRRRATKTQLDQASFEIGNEPRGIAGQFPQAIPPTQATPLPPPSPPQSISDAVSLDAKHEPFIPYYPVRARASSSAISADIFTSSQIDEYISSLQKPTSALDEFDHILSLPMNEENPVFDPFQALMRTIHDDTLSLVDIVRISLRRVREGTLNEDLMQQRVGFWRSLLHQLNFSIAEIDQQLLEFVHFSNTLNAPGHVELASKQLAKDTQQVIRNCIDLIDKSSDSLRAEMQIVDSRRSIAEAESVSKLTELAFVFVPLSFVASVYSVNFRGQDQGVPVYQFAAVAVTFVIVAYAVRLSIRSSRLIHYKNNTFEQIREEAGLQYSEPIPTHTFLTWAGKNSSRKFLRSLWTFLTNFAPLVLILAVVAAILSPIVVLWLRGINKGFSAVIAVLLLLLDTVLVYPIIVNASGEFELNPKAKIREIQGNRELNRKRREKLLKWKRRHMGGIDPESLGAGESASSDEDEVLSSGRSATSEV